MKINAQITDIYKNAAVVGKKSITINVKMQHSDRTLNSEEISKNIDHIIKNLSEKISWEERKIHPVK
jgi:phenylalanyl-tRNA synthetase beta subunit